MKNGTGQKTNTPTPGNGASPEGMRPQGHLDFESIPRALPDTLQPKMLAGELRVPNEPHHQERTA